MATKGQNRAGDRRACRSKEKQRLKKNPDGAVSSDKSMGRVVRRKCGGTVVS